MHTILGANGPIGRELSRQLHASRDPPEAWAPAADRRVRQVSRNSKAVARTDEVASADLLDAAATARAVAGSTVAYLVAGLKYDTKVWQTEWPVVMHNTIDAC